MEKKKKLFLAVLLITIVILIIQIVRTWFAHFNVGKYAADSWEIVWPVIVSTLIAVFGTLITNYVFFPLYEVCA